MAHTGEKLPLGLFAHLCRCQRILQQFLVLTLVLLLLMDFTETDDPFLISKDFIR